MAAVSAFAPPAAQLAMVGSLLSILAGLFLSYLEQEDERERRRAELLERLGIPLNLALDRELYDQYVAVSEAINHLATRMAPILREIAVLKLASVGKEITALADGTVVFSGTEAWRTVYERLLKSDDIKKYQSVALVRTSEYWQDPPGRQSMQTNFEAVRRGLLIERAVVLADELWPAHELLPRESVRPWIEEQHNHGLWITLVRESQLVTEPDLLADIGIYGERALGLQELDQSGRSLRFTLRFDPDAVRLAKERWQRLSLFATSYRKLLDRTEDSR